MKPFGLLDCLCKNPIGNLPFVHLLEISNHLVKPHFLCLLITPRLSLIKKYLPAKSMWSIQTNMLYISHRNPGGVIPISCFFRENVKALRFDSLIERVCYKPREEHLNTTRYSTIGWGEAALLIPKPQLPFTISPQPFPYHARR
jgi:hypothetical protein